MPKLSENFRFPLSFLAGFAPTGQSRSETRLRAKAILTILLLASRPAATSPQSPDVFLQIAILRACAFRPVPP